MDGVEFVGDSLGSIREDLLKIIRRLDHVKCRENAVLDVTTARALVKKAKVKVEDALKR